MDTVNISFTSSVQMDQHPIPKPEDLIMQGDPPQTYVATNG